MLQRFIGSCKKGKEILSFERMVSMLNQYDLMIAVHRDTIYQLVQQLSESGINEYCTLQTYAVRDKERFAQEDILLTVIITIFNVDSYLVKCIDSVRNQTYKNIEILLIDDGSTDQSGIICDAYVQKDGRIKVYHKENRGLVEARKTGVKYARGDVITFVDADDWIEPDMYQCMMEEYIRYKPDMVSSGILYEWEDRTEKVLDSVGEGVYEKAEIYKRILPRIAYDAAADCPGITASVWNKLFKPCLLREVLQNTDSKLTQGEDGAVTYLLTAKADRIVVIARSWYHYVQHEDSLIRQHDLSSFEKIYRLEKNLTSGFKELGIESEMKQQITYYVKSFLRQAVRKVYDMDLNDILFMFPYECIPPNSRILLYGAGRAGKSYHRCIQYGAYAVLSAWVDADYRNLQREGLDVEPPEVIMNLEYDYIVIAVSSRTMADEIRSSLLNFGVEENKIIWKEPRAVH